VERGVTIQRWVPYRGDMLVEAQGSEKRDAPCCLHDHLGHLLRRGSAHSRQVSPDWMRTNATCHMIGRTNQRQMSSDWTRPHATCHPIGRATKRHVSHTWTHAPTPRVTQLDARPNGTCHMLGRAFQRQVTSSWTVTAGTG